MAEGTKHPQKLLLFYLTNQRPFGLGTLKIREIMPFVPLTKLPHSHSAVIGTMSFRGSAVPVIDMAAAVGYQPLTAEERKTASIIVTDVQRQEIGFLVRSVRKIVETEWKKVMPPPKSLGDRAFITGLVNIDDQIVQFVTTNGRDALDLMLNANRDGKPINILVSDIEMPGLDGYELTFDVRDSGNALKQPYIILHTSLNSEMSVSYAKQVGADEALTKFDAEELLHAMLRGAEQG